MFSFVEKEKKIWLTIFTLLDVVVRKSTAIFQLFAGKDQSLLIWGNA
jgi:hypothetical protein